MIFFLLLKKLHFNINNNNSEEESLTKFAFFSPFALLQRNAKTFFSAPRVFVVAMQMHEIC
jgi:hypothetical protein